MLTIRTLKVILSQCLAKSAKSYKLDGSFWELNGTSPLSPWPWPWPRRWGSRPEACCPSRPPCSASWKWYNWRIWNGKKLPRFFAPPTHFQNDVNSNAVSLEDFSQSISSKAKILRKRGIKDCGSVESLLKFKFLKIILEKTLPDFSINLFVNLTCVTKLQSGPKKNQPETAAGVATRAGHLCAIAHYKVLKHLNVCAP